MSENNYENMQIDQFEVVNRVEKDTSIEEAKWLLGMVAVLGLTVLSTGVMAAMLGA